MIVSKNVFKAAATFAGLMFVSRLLSVFVFFSSVTSALINEASSIGIIGGADGPTALFLTSRLAGRLVPQLLITILPLILEIMAYLFVLFFSLKKIRESK